MIFFDPQKLRFKKTCLNIWPMMFFEGKSHVCKQVWVSSDIISLINFKAKKRSRAVIFNLNVRMVPKNKFLTQN